MKKLSIALAASLVILAGCGGMSSSSSDVQATVLEQGQHGALKDVTQEQYHDQAAFKAGWVKLYAGQSAPELPNVDFTKNTVVLYAIGEHNSGGYKARVLKAQPAATGTGFDLGFEVTIPGIGCHATTQEVTRPFIVISIPTTTDATIDDAVQRRQPDCTAK
jgi:hypothetical protein